MRKIYHVKNIFALCSILIDKNTFKVALRQLLKNFILFKTFFSLKLSFLLKINKKTCSLKTWENFQMTYGNPVYITLLFLLVCLIDC